MVGKRLKLLVPVVFGVSVVAIGGVAAYLYSDGYFGAIDSPLESAKIVPNEAVMTGFISTDPQSWSKLQQFGTPEAQKLLDKEIKNFQKEVFTDSQVDYEKDVKPWLGSVMFAVVPSTTSKQTQEADLLMVLAIKNKFSIWDFGNRLKNDKKGEETKEIDYNGVKIYENTNKGKKNYAAILKSHLVMADEIKTVQLAIDTFKGKPSVASKGDVTKVLSKGLSGQNYVAQFYVPDYPAMVQQLSGSKATKAGVSPETLKQLKQVKSIVGDVGIDNDGIRLKAIAKLDPAAFKLEYKPSPGKIVAQFPSETIALINGHGISRYWSAIVEQSKTDPQSQKALDEVRQQVKGVNLNLDKDILGWMDGEFAIAAIPSNQGILSQVGFGGALVFETSDRATAEATLSKLDAIAKGYSITVGQRNVAGKAVTEWTIPQQGALVGHGWLNQNSVFIAIGGPLVDVLANPTNQTLDSNASFKAVTGSLPKPNAGYFYLDMDKTMSVVNGSLSPTQNSPVSPDTRAILNSMSGIGFTATQPDRSTTQFEMLLALKPKGAK